MIWEILLSATIETSLGLLAEVGFGDAARDLRDKLLNTEQKKRVAALDTAFESALQASANSAIAPLLKQRAFQEEVVRALLDPMEGFNIQAAAETWDEKFPEHAVPLRRFFNTLQNNLLADSIWGPVLERYQSLRFQQDVRQALQQRKLPESDVTLVKAVSQAAEQYRATLHGGGAIAQGPGAKAVGEGGILIEGSVQKIVQITINQFIGPEKSTPAKGNGRAKYLELTASQANLLPWMKFTTDYATPEHGESLNLADVYIDLDTTEMRHMEREEELRQFLLRQREAERISAQEMVSRKSKLLMMGDPGSGKSTFVKHIAYLMAQAALAKDTAPWLGRLGEWKHGSLLPVHIELRQVMAQADGKSKGARLISNYLRAELTEWGLEDYWSEFNDALQDKQGGLLFLLDGLDEVPTAQRQAMVDAVNDLASLYPRHRYVVTCRPYAYVGQPWKLTGFHEVTLAPFSDEQIDRFIQNWYERLTERKRIERAASGEKARRLIEAVHRRDLLGLAERPLLLTVMAQLHAYAGQLPEDRTQLYADAVQLLLQRWESRLGAENGILEYLAVPGLKMSDLESGLYEVAFRAHSAGDSRDGTADISEGQLRQYLARYLNHDWNKAGLFVEYIRERAGLLVRHKTEAYTFPHRSFQEFLSACYWLGMEDYPGESVRLVCADWDRWREVFVLAAGYAARTKRLGQAIAAVNALLPQSCKGQFPPESLQASLLAGQSLVEIGLVGVRREPAGLAVLERTQDWLLNAMQNDQVPAKTRAEAGRVLAKLGDPRPEVLTCERMAFCHVPAGEFIFGEGDNQKKINLPEYWMGKYPVTNAQFAQFVAAKGYENQDYWEEAIKADYWKNGQVYSNLWDSAPRTAPEDFGEPFNLSNHPVVGISWYEALAFTRWLSEQLPVISEQWSVNQKKYELNAHIKAGRLEVALPSEEQWEKAARGTDGRIYPWGEKPDPNRANYDDTRLGTTSAVGCFPGGQSPYGLLDASGNIWEWVNGENNLRGGSFNNSEGRARCAYRSLYYPFSWYRDLGFRLVLSPLLLSPP
jgi:formylglycine-generating enzyme required for sulfatase activity/tRNA A37 threonylcarbamoyladenosine biosynthesis protein TsaE